MSSEPTVAVTLGGKNYIVPILTLGQLEDIGDVMKKPDAKPFDLFRFVMRDALPAIDDFDGLRARPDEIKSATRAIMRESGIPLKDDEPGEAKPERVIPTPANQD